MDPLTSATRLACTAWFVRRTDSGTPSRREAVAKRRLVRRADHGKRQRQREARIALDDVRVVEDRLTPLDQRGDRPRLQHMNPAEGSRAPIRYPAARRRATGCPSRAASGWRSAPRRARSSRSLPRRRRRRPCHCPASHRMRRATACAPRRGAAASASPHRRRTYRPRRDRPRRPRPRRWPPRRRSRWDPRSWDWR